jgi:hypothetical protein
MERFARDTFLDFHLRNVPNGWDTQPAPIQYFQMGDDLWHGVNTLAGEHQHIGPLSRSRGADRSPASAGTLPETITSDPHDPRPPPLAGPTLQASLDQGPYDQVPLVESRGDVLTFTTAGAQWGHHDAGRSGSEHFHQHNGG